ncbi:hypothetical protein [uncultured Gimesia sp.]
MAWSAAQQDENTRLLRRDRVSRGVHLVASQHHAWHAETHRA